MVLGGYYFHHYLLRFQFRNERIHDLVSMDSTDVCKNCSFEYLVCVVYQTPPFHLKHFLSIICLFLFTLIALSASFTFAS